MITAFVGTWERSCFCFVDAGPEAFGARMKSIWLWTCPLGACQVAVLNNFWGWTVLSRMSCGSLQTLGVSVKCGLSLQCQIFLLSLPSVSMHLGLLWHPSRLELQVYPSWESLLRCYQAARRTHWPPPLHDCDVVLSHWDPDGDEFAGEESAADSLPWMSPHTGVSSCLCKTRSCVPHLW